MLVKITFAVLALLGSTTTAMYEDCDGNWYDHSSRESCERAIAKLDPDEYYTDGFDFSAGNCAAHYGTKNSGEQPVLGSVLINRTTHILEVCMHKCGTMWTWNCGDCHVTFNFRPEPLDHSDAPEDPGDKRMVPVQFSV